MVVRYFNDIHESSKTQHKIKITIQNIKAVFTTPLSDEHDQEFFQQN